MTQDPGKSICHCLPVSPINIGRVGSSLPGMSTWHILLQRKKKYIFFQKIANLNIRELLEKVRCITRHARVLPRCSLIMWIAWVPSWTLTSVAGVSAAQVETSELAHSELSSQLLMAVQPKVAQSNLLPSALNQLLGCVLQFKEELQPGTEENIFPSPEPLQTSVWGWMFPRRQGVWSTTQGRDEHSNCCATTGGHFFLWQRFGQSADNTWSSTCALDG